jgi:hypothetical protein
MKSLNWVLFLIGVSFMCVPFARAEQWNEMAAGRVYVDGSSASAKVRIPVPSNINWDLLEIYSQEDPDAVGNSVVGFYDFKIAKSATPVSNTDDMRYIQYPYAGFVYDSSWRGKSGFFGNVAPSPDIYVGNSTSASYPIGQWIEWIASQQTHN